ncbi:conjugal transfer protein TraD [Bradyrhizobium sp.]|uniref:conjugal transfer protein TraD n=1 Tax=Bradyrhizobium sp. TaxID=376 RepID=UPI001EC793A0|nr:conjugal transfer protein TraD [Bradyrhizobium sp.]MBV9983758.1 conjugal transfer protein TraD [Bradyrhizobium sp.]
MSEVQRTNGRLSPWCYAPSPSDLVVKGGLFELTGDDRATTLGALLWMADKLQSDQG